MEPMEQLAVLTAMEKAVKDRIREVRAECNDKMLGAYDSIGAEKIALKVCGTKVGDMTVAFHSEGFAVTDEEAFGEFAADYGLAAKRKRIRPEMMESAIKAIESAFEPDVAAETIEEYTVLSPDWEKAMERGNGRVLYMDSGMPVPGVEYRPKRVNGTMVRGCKPDEVLPLLQSLPGGIDGLLLGEGGEE